MGPVPLRVNARVKAGLLDLLDEAVERGWAAARACSVLELDERRARRWRARAHLDDATPGRAVHGLMPWEVDAIVEVFERFGDIDRSYRKLAHRGSYEGVVWVSESTVYRVLAAQGLVLPAPPPRSPSPAPAPFPEWAEWRPNQIWIYDFSHFTRAGRVAFAVMDVVSRKWLRTLVTTEESATQVEVLFTAALGDEGLWERIEARHAGSPLDGDDPDVPILLAMSDNGPQMRAGSTREFLAMCSIVARFGRPGTPTDQAWIETLFGHVKREWPHLEKITDGAQLAAELEVVRADYNGRRLHAGIGYVTPDDEHAGRGDAIRQARRDGLARSRAQRLTYHRDHTEPNPPCTLESAD
jgi:transposase InsO family protein